MEMIVLIAIVAVIFWLYDQEKERHKHYCQIPKPNHFGETWQCGGCHYYYVSTFIDGELVYSKVWYTEV